MARSRNGHAHRAQPDEIDQLRRMGQRDYFEFTVQRKSGATKVGSIQIELKDTNTKKNVTPSTSWQTTTLREKRPLR